MKNIRSLAACFLVCIVLVQLRSVYPGKNSGQSLMVTQWDAFGYYAYLPGLLIHHDVKNLQWLPAVDSQYSVTGGEGWQAEKLDNGNYVFKYLGGVAIMELPLFLAGHLIALNTHYPPDGFSPPYQYALAFGIIVYCLLALLILRRVLLTYFNDVVAGLTLLLVGLATNLTVYAGISGGLSHAYIFLLYTLVLYTTMQWHNKPRMMWALLTGWVIGLATICRPTEAIMLFIPFMWGMQNKASSREKWQLVKRHRKHAIAIIIGGILGILPQLIYWKSVTGSFIYDVGSKWDFLLPHFRVLWGWEKGWFIYTPVTILFILGMFRLRSFPFQKSVLWFCLLNIWIIIAWHEWRYAASYSTRALVQSYPVFALSLAALIDDIQQRKWGWIIYPITAYLLGVNYFQTRQYGDGIIHYDDMNRLYYSHIYLNPHPTAEDMSLLDTQEYLSDTSVYTSSILFYTDTLSTAQWTRDGNYTIAVLPVDGKKTPWIKLEATINAHHHLWQSFLNAGFESVTDTVYQKIRLFNALSNDTAYNRYAFYMPIPATLSSGSLQLFISNTEGFEGAIQSARITGYNKKNQP